MGTSDRDTFPRETTDLQTHPFICPGDVCGTSAVRQGSGASTLQVRRAGERSKARRANRAGCWKVGTE